MSILLHYKSNYLLLHKSLQIKLFVVKLFFAVSGRIYDKIF